jgi:cyanate lyase
MCADSVALERDMSETAKEREASSRACVAAMRAKGLTFRKLADAIGVSPFITAAALLGQMALPKEAAAKAAKALAMPEAEAFLAAFPIAARSEWRFRPIPPSIASTRSCRSMARR